MYGLTTTTPPAVEPVSLGEAKLHLRVDHDADDLLIEGWVSAAREQTELWTGRRWVTQTLTLSLAGWPCDDGTERGYVGYGAAPIRLPVEPVQSVTAVRYYDAAGVLQTVTAPQAWADHSPPLVYPAPLGYWPPLQTGRAAPVRVEFVAGYGSTPAAVPWRVKAAIMLVLTYWNEHRGDTKDPTECGIPEGAKALLTSLSTGSYQ